MKTTSSLVERFRPFQTDFLIRFLKSNKQDFDERIFSVAMRFIEGETLESIALSENVTIERIRQLLGIAERKFKYFLTRSNVSELRKELSHYKELCKQLETQISAQKITLAVNKVQSPTELSKLNLSRRALNALKSMNINFAEELTSFSTFDLFIQKNIGIKTITEIEKVLDAYGLRLESI